MTEKELKQAQAQELAETWTKLSERNQGVVANIINTMAIVERAVQEVAEFVQEQLIDKMGTTDRGVKNDTQTQYDSIHVLRQTDMPAILIELAFITNDEH